MAHESNSLDARLDPRLAAALAEVARRLGSAARVLAGAAAEPRDLDVEIAAADAAHAAAALGCALAADEGRGWASLRGRCIVEGIEVDVSAAITVVGAEWGLEPDEQTARAWSRSVTVGGYPIMLAPVEEQLVRALVAGDWERIARIAGGGGPPPRAAYVFRRLASAKAVR